MFTKVQGLCPDQKTVQPPVLRFQLCNEIYKIKNELFMAKYAEFKFYLPLHNLGVYDTLEQNKSAND